MKPVVTLLLLLSIFSCQLHAQTTYQTQFPRSNFNMPHSVYPAQDGGTFVFGERSDICTYSDDCQYMIYVYHFNGQGKLLWAKDFNTRFSLARPVAMATKDGGFAFLGRLYDTLGRTWKGGLLVKCNSSGNIVWSKQVSSRKYTAFDPLGIQEDKDGNFLLFYTVANDMFYSEVLQMVKLNPKGNLVWNQTGRLASSYPTDIYGGVAFRQIDNRYYVLGSNNCQNCDGVLTANILVLDTSGAVITCRDISKPVNYYVSTTANRIFIKDNRTYLLGTYGIDFSTYKYFLVPVTDTSTVVTGTGFSSDPFSLQYQLRKFTDVYPLSVAYGYFDSHKILNQMIPTSGAWTMTLLRYDSLGRICPSYTSPNTDTTSTRQTFNVSANRFIKIPDSVSLADIGVRVSTDTVSYTAVCEGSAGANRIASLLPSIPANNKRVTLYPNPAGAVVNIIGLQQHASVAILSSAGAVVKTVWVSSAHPSIAVSDMKAGMYFLRIAQKGSEAYVASFIKQ